MWEGWGREKLSTELRQDASGITYIITVQGNDVWWRGGGQTKCRTGRRPEMFAIIYTILVNLQYVCMSGISYIVL